MLGMTNTLIIGQNTASRSINPVILPFVLPNSGVVVWFGNAITAFAEERSAEDIGLSPDIWVHGDALTAALALVGD